VHVHLYVHSSCARLQPYAQINNIIVQMKCKCPSFVHIIRVLWSGRKKQKWCGSLICFATLRLCVIHRFNFTPRRKAARENTILFNSCVFDFHHFHFGFSAFFHIHCEHGFIIINVLDDFPNLICTRETHT